MFENFRRLWTDARPGARAALVTGFVLIAVIAALALRWALQRDEQALFADLSPEDAAAVSAELDRIKLPYRVAEDGGTILVERSQVHATRMKLMGQGVNLRGGAGLEIFANNDFGMTDFAQRVNYQRALQGELTRTISALEEVRQVRVHLVLPESGLFRRSTVKPKAAVTLALKRGRTLAAAQVLGIQRLVAAAVPEIEAQAVTIVDDHGIALSRPADAEGADGMAGGDARLAAKTEIEQLVARKAVVVLDRAFGPGRAIVSVDVTLDHNQVRVTREDVLPGNPRSGEGLVTRRRVTSSSSSSAAPLAATGTAADDAAPARGTSSTEADFTNGRRVEQVVSRPGSVRQISVGILLPHPLAPERAESLRRLIAASIGLVTSRGDEIAITSLDQFAAGAAGGAASSVPLAAPEPLAPLAAARDSSGDADDAGLWLMALLVAVMAVLGVVVALVLAGRRQPRRLQPAARDDLLRQLRRWLAQQPPAPEPRL